MAETERRGLRILALDGGGVRGLSELLILGQLMPLVKEESGVPDDTLDRPCKVFDIICGTSTGGLIAILLGCLKLTVKQAIDEYQTLFEETFGNPRFKLPGRETKYSTEASERVVKGLIARYAGDEDAAMLQDNGQCKVFVCTQRALALRAVNPFRMRSYADSTNIDGLTMWQAARATSAAPTFFKRLVIGKNEYIDGGLGSNNPCKALLRELERIYQRDTSQTVSCIINIGTGIPKVNSLKKLKGLGFSWWLDVVRTLEEISTDCEVAADEMASLFQSTTDFHFRFNVEQGLQGIEMDKHEELNAITAHTEVYLDQKKVQASLLLAAKALASHLPGPRQASKPSK